MFESKVMNIVNDLRKWPSLSLKSCEEGGQTVMRHFQEKGFIHGQMLTIRLLLESGVCDSFLVENLHLYQLLLNTTHQIVTTAKNLLDDELVCAGMMTEDLQTDLSELIDENEEQGSQNLARNSNLELCSQRACWLTLKESAFLLSSLSKSFSTKQDGLDQEILDKIVDVIQFSHSFQRH
eukprot:472492-Hanusia_phi.AAC.8